MEVVVDEGSTLMLCTSPGTASVVPAGVTVTSCGDPHLAELGQRQVDGDDCRAGPDEDHAGRRARLLALDQVDLPDPAADRRLQHGAVEVLLGAGQLLGRLEHVDLEARGRLRAARPAGASRRAGAGRGGAAAGRGAGGGARTGGLAGRALGGRPRLLLLQRLGGRVECRRPAGPSRMPCAGRR